MSEAIKRIEKILGVPLGEKGTSWEPFLDAFETMTLTRVPGWISYARAGKPGYSGRKRLLTLDQAVSKNRGSGKKDILYREIAEQVVLVREPAQNTGAESYLSNNLVNEVGTTLQLRPQDIRVCIRAMRADLVFGYQEDSNLTRAFVETAEAYLESHANQPPSLRRESIVRLNEKWDRRSLQNFYKNLYCFLSRGPRGIGGWTPYEMKVMREFYLSRIKQKPNPSRFDESVMATKSEKERLLLAQEVFRETGIPLDANVVVKHRNAIIYGSPKLKYGEV